MASVSIQLSTCTSLPILAKQKHDNGFSKNKHKEDAQTKKRGFLLLAVFFSAATEPLQGPLLFTPTNPSPTHTNRQQKKRETQLLCLLFYATLHTTTTTS